MEYENIAMKGKEILVIENNPEYIATAKEAYKYANIKLVSDYKEAIDVLNNGISKYDAVISTLYIDNPNKPESLEFAKKCLEKKVPFAILANGEKELVKKTRLENYDNSELINLTGVEEDPVKQLIVNPTGFNKTKSPLWGWAYSWAQTNKNQ